MKLSFLKPLLRICTSFEYDWLDRVCLETVFLKYYLFIPIENFCAPNMIYKSMNMQLCTHRAVSPRIRIRFQ